MNNEDRIFPFKIADDATDSPREETIKWRSGAQNYEIHISILDSIELKDLVTHCIQYKAKVSAAGTTAAQLGGRSHQRSVQLAA